MAIGVKVMKRPTQQTSYLRATLKGMALTFSHLLRPKVTMQYPEEKSSKDWTLSSRWRGTHRMLTDEQGRATCVACGLCPQICPANCIKLVPGEDEEGHRYPLITRSTSSAASSAATARRCAPRKRSTWACTTRTRSTRATASCTTSNG